MIVQPDFLKHFKTQALVKVSRWEAAPLAVLRLWGHCQVSRRWQFPNMTPEQLAALCEWGEHKPGCATALLKAGFIRRMEGGGFEAHQWEEQNSRLVHNWKQGPNGGRPKKSGGKGSKEGEKSNPDETQGFSSNNPSKTDKIRSEKIRSDQNVPKSNSGGTGESVKGGNLPVHGEGGGSKAKSVFVVPVFDPIASGTFPRELERAALAVRNQVKVLKARQDAWEWSDEPDADVMQAIEVTQLRIVKCEDATQRERLEGTLRELEAKRTKRVKGKMVPAALAVLEAWNDRALKIEMAMAGARV
jgi:hypothetical protein